MAKRSNFARRANDLYETTDPRAVTPLLPHIARGSRYAEVCAASGALIALLNGHAKCVWASDIEPRAEGVTQADALTIGPQGADLFITNPPWTRSILHPLIVHLSDLAPTWLLFDANWANTKQARPFMARCRKIVAVGRLKWIPGSPHQGKDDAAWFLFDKPIAGSAPVFYAQGVAPPETPRRPVRTCFDCSQQIGQHGKWTLAQRGGVLTTVHRHCDNPNSRYARDAQPIAPAPLLEWRAA